MTSWVRYSRDRDQPRRNLLSIAEKRSWWRWGDSQSLLPASTLFQNNSVGQDAILDVIATTDPPSSYVRQMEYSRKYKPASSRSQPNKQTNDYVDVKVDRDNSAVVSNVNAFVTQYNKLVDKITSLISSTPMRVKWVYFSVRENLCRSRKALVEISRDQFRVQVRSRAMVKLVSPLMTPQT